MMRRILAILACTLVGLPLPLVQAAPPFDTTPPFTDQNYHEYLLYNPDTTEFDIVILPPASPYALRDIQVLEQSVDMWRDGIRALGSPWLRDGVKIRTHMAGLEYIPPETLWDAEIVIISAAANPALLLGIGLESPLYACHNRPFPLTTSSWSDVPGFHQHPGSMWGTFRAECNVGGYTCFVVNTNFLSTPTPTNRRNMFDLNSHELGHCLGIGHVGDAGDFSATAFPPKDIMSYQSGSHVHCVSTLNILALETTYAHLLGRVPNRNTAGGFVHMVPEDWRAHDCTEPTATHTDLGPIQNADPLTPRDDEDEEPPQGEPTLTISSPSPGTQVEAGPITVTGSVDRLGTPSNALRAEAGGPYAGIVDQAIAILGAATGGAGPATCSWSGPGVFADPASCDTTVTFTEPGEHEILLTVDDGESTAQDSATITVSQEGAATRLYFTSSYTRQGTDFTDCGQTYRYNMTPAAPTPGKAYAAFGAAAISCAVQFAGQTPQEIRLADGVQVDLWWACDKPAPMSVSAGAQGASTSRLLVRLRNAEGTSLGEKRYTEENPTTVICDSNARYTPVTITGTATVPAGQTLVVEVVPFILTGDAEQKWLEKNLHFLIGGDRASQVGPVGATDFTPSSARHSSRPLMAGTASDSASTTYYFHRSGPTGISGNADQIAALQLNLPMDTNAPTQSQSALIYTSVGDNNPNNPTPFHDAAAWTSTSPVTLRPGDDVTVAWYAQSLASNLASGWDVKLFVGATNVATASQTAQGAATTTTRFEHTFTGVVQAETTGLLRVWIDPWADLDHIIYYDSVNHPSALTITPSIQQPLQVDAGGPYTGRPGQSILITATLTGGDGTATCEWTTSDDGTFTSTASCQTSVAFSTEGAKTLTVTAADATGTDTSSASVNVSESPAGERIEAFVNDEASPRATHPLDTAPDRSASLSFPLDLSGLNGATSLRFDWVDQDGTLLDTVERTIDVQGTTRQATIQIVNPQQNTKVTPPMTFEGTYDTFQDGDTGTTFSQRGASFDAFARQAGKTTQEQSFLDSLRGLAMQQWSRDPAVRALLDSGEFRLYQHELGKQPGFVAAIPLPKNQLLVAFEGQAPGALPTPPQGLTIRQVEGVKPTPLQGFAPSLDVKTITPQEWQRSLNGPNGPHRPGEQQQGAGPGSALLIDGGGLCSASYLFEDVATGTYYLATAGHCIVKDANDATSYTGQANPDKVASKIQICVRNCYMNWAAGLPLQGTYITLGPNGDYHPVAFAKSGGVGSDFGLIEIPPSHNIFLRPWLSLWGGPTQFDRANAGDLLVHYGHGAYCCPVVGAVATRTPYDQGRAALSIFGNRALGFDAIGWASGGDSGSAVGTGGVRTDKQVIGQGGSGVLTHGILIDHIPVFSGTDLEGGLDLAQSLLGLRPSLVREGANIRIPDPNAFNALITSPTSGATIDPADTPIQINGTASFPLGTGTAGTQTLTYYLHAQRNPNCSNVIRWMDTTPSPTTETGSNCGNVLAAGGAALPPAINFDYRALPTPAANLLFDPTRTMTAEVWMAGFLSEPVVVGDFEARLESNGRLLAQGRATKLPVVDGRAIVPMTLLESGARGEEELVFRFQVHHASPSGAFLRYGGTQLSQLRIPIATPPTQEVQVSIGNPDFTPETLLPVTGANSWTATWDPTGLPDGTYTLYARAIQGTSTSPASQIQVQLQASGPKASFTAQIDALTVDFTDTSAPASTPIQSWTWNFGDGNGSQEANPSHTYAQAGNYTVTLTVTDQAGRSSSATQDVQVRHPDWSVQIRLLGPSGLIIDWTELLRPASGESGVWSYDWNPEDAQPGEYRLQARLLQQGEDAASHETTFFVEAQNQAPTAHIAGPDATKKNKDVTFSGAASTDPDGTIVSYAWDLGDGTQATGVEVTHRYKTEGSYTVSLLVTDQEGATATATHTIHVGKDKPKD